MILKEHYFTSYCSSAIVPLTKTTFSTVTLNFVMTKILLDMQTAILGTVPMNSSKLVRIIENWGATNPKIVVEGVQLIVVSVCDLNHIDENKMSSTYNPNRWGYYSW